MLTVQEVAERLNVSVGAVYKSIQAGTLGHYRFGVAIRISEEQLADYLENVRVIAAPARPRIRHFKHL